MEATRATAAHQTITARSKAALAAMLATATLIMSVGVPRTDVALPAITAAAAAASVDPAVEQALATDTLVKVVVQAQAAAIAPAMEAIEATGGTVGTPLPIIEGFAAQITAAGLERLTATPGVRNVSFDGPVVVDHSPPLGESGGDSFFPETIRADVLRAQGIDGSGVGIAIVDTGITEHTDLADRVIGGIDFSTEGTTNDSYGHGTFIAGIAAGSGAASNGTHDGVAPGAHVVPVKIAGANGAADVSHVLAAIQWTVAFKSQYGIRVMNLSLGTDSTQPRMLSPLNYAVERAWDSGLVVVVSAGNRGDAGPGRIPKPADDPLVITVGATDSNGTLALGDDTVAAYSSRGPSIADQIVKPDLVAPGSHLIGAMAPGSGLETYVPQAHIGTDYIRGSGTSYAAAVVSGAVALLLDANPTWTPNQVKGALRASAAPGPVGDPNVDGAGIVDVAAAAALTNPPKANKNVARGSGLGSLAQDRGSLRIEIQDPVSQLVSLLSGDTTAQGRAFSAAQYTSSSWTGSDWYGSDWYGSDWYGSDWYGSDWYGSDWYGSDWYGSDWYGSDWY